MSGIDWSKAPEGAQAACAASSGLYAAWYRINRGEVEQICEGAGCFEWTSMGGRTDFPFGHVMRPISATADLIAVGYIEPPTLHMQRFGRAYRALPAVGTVCEWAGCTFSPEDPAEPDLRVGDQVTIIAHFKDGQLDLAAFTFNPQIHNPDRGTAWVGQGAHGCFRPIRTPEQIAFDLRDKSAEELYLTINWNESPSTWANLSQSRRADYFKAIDAGWNKFEIINEPKS